MAFYREWKRPRMSQEKRKVSGAADDYAPVTGVTIAKSDNN
jgi:hypothetical protein